MKGNKVTNFIKKNAYYFVFILTLAVITTITVMLIVNAKDNSLSTGNENVIIKPDNTPSIPNNPSEPSTPSEPDNEASSVIIFDLPCSGSIIKDYVADSVVYNQTLGVYQGHKAIDFSASEGAKVFACYDGTIESIVVSKLEGTTITIDHSNGLKSIYNSLEAVEGLSSGAVVKKGEVIGYVSSNNKKEYLDGPHLHFSVSENGVVVNPSKYLVTEEK